MGRTVRDAALLLTAMTGTDQDDAATSKAETHHEYSANLTADALDGKRIGIIRSWYGADSNPDVDAIYQASIGKLQEAGAILVDDINIDADEMYDAEYEVLLYEFRSGLNAYLENSDAPVQSLRDLIAYNEANHESVMPWFGQEIFLAADAKGPLTEEAYLTALETSKRISQSSIDNLMDEHELDALIAPTNGPARPIDLINGDASGIGSSSLAAVSGYPSITVPAGFVSGMPVGLSFIGKAWNEKQLIEIAYAFEQTTRIRKPPKL